MIRLLHCLCILLICVFIGIGQAWAGSLPLLGAGGSTAASGRTCNDDTASTNFLARTSGLSNTEQDAYCNLIKGLETDSIITGNLSGAAGCGSVLDALYILATNNTTTATLNLCGTSFSLVSHGSPTFTADVGWAGDGSAAFLDTQWIPGINGVNYTQNSGTIGAYIQTSGAGTTNTDAMGADTSGLHYARFQPINGANFLYGINTGGSFGTNANGSPQGAWVVTRTGSTTTTVYKNGATTLGSAATASTTPLPAFSVYLFAINNSGAASNFSNYQLSAAFASAGLTSTQAFAINNRINTYMTALGHNIY